MANVIEFDLPINREPNFDLSINQAIEFEMEI